jgi:glutamate-5-semialdehyde dehydrogenase
VTVRPNGLRIAHTRAPLGCVGVIYESRPNVTIDVGALCLKTGNAVLLRGGKEAIHSNRVLVSLMREALTECGVDPNAVCLVERTGREYADEMMLSREWLDVLIPRGGAGLIQSVVEKAKVPVIETGAGNCHMLIHSDADLEMALKLALSAKISLPSVCNSLEKLLVMRDVAPVFLPRFAEEAGKAGLELRGDEGVRAVLPDVVPMSEDDLRREYNDMILSIMLTDSLENAVRHINRYSTHHSEAIVTTSLESAAYFQQHVDSAAVYVNASPRFTDGGEFGLGAEIGISTQKLHARGPMGMYALTTDKYLINGNGQTR